MRRSAVVRFVVAGVVAVAALAPSVAAAQDPAPPAGSGETAPVARVHDAESLRRNGWLREDWYVVRAGEMKVGWLRRALSLSGEGEAAVVAREFEMFLDVAGDGTGSRSVWRTEFPLAGPQRMLRASARSDEAGRRSSRDAVRTGDRLDIVTDSRGRRTTGAVVAPEVTFDDEIGLERLAAASATRQGGPVGAVLDVRGFVLATLSVASRRLAVRAVHGEGAARELEVEVFAGPGMQERLRVDASGAVVSGSLGSLLSYSRTDRAAAESPVDRQAIEALSSVPMEGALGDVPKLRRLTLSCPGELAGAFLAHPRQIVRREPERTLVIVARDAPRAEVTAADREAALAPEPDLDIDSAEIRGVAESLCVGTNSRKEQAEAICRFVAETLADETVLGAVPARELLVKKRGDCTEHVQLFVALCRSVALPARRVEGLCWKGDEKRAFGWHAWAEVAIEGRWVAVDPTMGRMDADAARVVVDASPQGRVRMWGAKFTLVAAERD